LVASKAKSATTLLLFSNRGDCDRGARQRENQKTRRALGVNQWRGHEDRRWRGHELLGVAFAQSIRSAMAQRLLLSRARRDHALVDDHRIRSGSALHHRLWLLSRPKEDI
jgi:hypothetical protein